MKRLDLNIAERRRVPLAVWLMLLVGGVLSVDAGLRVVSLGDELDRANMRSGTRPRSAMVVSASTADPALAKDLRAAEQVVQRLALPWDDLFRTVETAASDRVALLAIEPDAQKKELAISGEALDYLALLTYVARLSEPGQLTDVHLVRHETKPDDPRHPLTFTIAANWRAQR
ncbi:MAG: hypothetical protein OEU94_10905 [Aquincola sp.]|nr:hypothetical protein [Aquincola sp.]MDH4289281.1 hypothetical protein [Aquincola sp.]MDH5331704.1 hypothetical protein [Aquincola sp.]